MVTIEKIPSITATTPNQPRRDDRVGAAGVSVAAVIVDNGSMRTSAATTGAGIWQVRDLTVADHVDVAFLPVGRIRHAVELGLAGRPKL
ncbi:hypothetical protein ACWEV3_30700 [Saccharopolyspora sp. NPDC003752]